MIHGIYINDLIDVYYNLREHYSNSKHLLKDLTHHTIKSFIQPFFDMYYAVQIKNSVNLDNLGDFVSTYFDEFKTKQEIDVDYENEISNTEINNKADLEVKGKEDFIYIKFFFFENCLKVLYSEDIKLQKIQIFFPTAENLQKLTDITISLFNSLISTFSLHLILSNLKLFTFYLKSLLIISFNCHNFKKEVKSFINNNRTNQKENENKKLLISFLFAYEILSINVDQNLSIEIIHEHLESFVNLLLGSKSFIKTILNSSSDKLICTTHNNLLFIFNKFLKKLKKDKKYFSTYNDFIDKFLAYLNSGKKIKEEEYENFIFIFTSVLNEVFLKPKENINEMLLKLLFKILESNHPPLHKMSIEILAKIKKENLIQSKFLENFVSVFDVLDGYNSHLFKSLCKELESLIIECEESKDEIQFEDFLFLQKNKNNQTESSISQIFSIKFNYFIILANKIKNHENTRIQKYFIKFFSNLVKNSNLKNKNFEYFIYSTLMKMLNNPMFYPENESISYHAKIGITAQNFFYNWLEMSEERNDFENNFQQFLIGIETSITFKRIFVYLFNSIQMIMMKLRDRNNKRYKFHFEILSTLNAIIDNNSKHLTNHQKQKFWITVSSLLTQSDLVEYIYSKNDGPYFSELIKLFYSFISNLMPIRKDCLLNEFNFYFKLKSCEELNLMIELFANLFCRIINTELVTNDEEFNKTMNSFESVLEGILGKNINLSTDSILNLFWFIELISNKEEMKFYFQFINNFNKLGSSYISESYKEFILKNFSIMLNQLDYLMNNGHHNDLLSCLTNHNVTYCIENFWEYLTQLFINFVHIAFNKNPNSSLELSRENLFFIDHFELIQDIMAKYFTVYLAHVKNNSSIVSNVLKMQFKISESLFKIDPAIYDLMNNSTKFLNIPSVKVINYVLSFIKSVQTNIVCILNINKSIFEELVHNNDFVNNFVNSLQILIEFVNSVEGVLEKEKKIWMKETETKYYFNNSTMDVIKIKTLILFYMSNIPHANILYILNEVLSNKHIKDIDNYSERLMECLEKSNDNEVYYVLKILSIYLYINSSTISENFLTSYVNTGFKTLTERRENLNFLNTFTFLESFINSNVLKNLKFSALPIIQKSFNIISDLNEKRSWLLLKVWTDLILNVFKDFPALIHEIDEVILNLAESKETRGEDSYMIDTSPEFLYMPFNMKKVDMLKSNIASEDVSKYGLYSRIKIIEYFDTHLNVIQPIVYLNLIERILEILDKNSSMKSEMLFTAKHRKKLRLSQFLLILSKAFVNVNPDENRELLTRLEKVTKSVFQKVNLSSVRYYFELYCINFAIIKPSIIEFFLNVLYDPNSKTHCVISSLIIIAVLLLEKKYPFGTQTYNAILTLCTSNICNIRGFAQYFVYKFKDLYLQSKNEANILPKCFYEYLINNSQIIKFFKRIDETYQNYQILIHDCNVKTLLDKNFDELNCEIIPIDLLKEFKENALEMVKIDSTDSSKPNYSWKLEIEDDDSIPTEKASNDFQKKYRPEEIETNSPLACLINPKKKRRLDAIVMASLIDKAPNLGGLARTCEVFNIGAMTISSETYLNDNAFLTAAASAERWLPMVCLPVGDIEKYIKTYRKLGYTIIGLEQTANSVSLKEYEFNEKCVIVLGSEKEGIPQNLIHLLDVCVIIPQFGEIRSLNVHVSAALMLWEFVNSCINNN